MSAASNVNSSNTSRPFDAEASKVHTKAAIDDIFEKIGPTLEKTNEIIFNVGLDYASNYTGNAGRGSVPVNVISLARPLTSSAAKTSVKASQKCSQTSANISIDSYGGCVNRNSSSNNG